MLLALEIVCTKYELVFNRYNKIQKQLFHELFHESDNNNQYICHKSGQQSLTCGFVSRYFVQDQDSLLVKRRNDNHKPGPVIRELVPSSHQRSELSNTILCIFSG